MGQLNRREFISTIAAAGACLACGEMCFADAPAAAPSAGGKVDIGVASDYAADGLFDKFVRTDKIIVVREGDKIRAMSAICTHKAATVTVKGAEIVCPKHNSRYALDGKPTKGPATAALFHLGISQNPAGHLLVDRSKRYGINQLTEPGSYVKVG
jgi:cytochrome b6-f complex iron-sulfur subunit